jgi:hypothetical protein
MNRRQLQSDSTIYTQFALRFAQRYYSATDLAIIALHGPGKAG